MTKPFAAADGCRDFAFAAVLNALLGRCLLVYHLLERHVLPRHIVFLLAVRKKAAVQQINTQRLFAYTIVLIIVILIRVTKILIPLQSGLSCRKQDPRIPRCPKGCQHIRRLRPASHTSHGNCCIFSPSVETLQRY